VEHRAGEDRDGRAAPGEPGDAATGPRGGERRRAVEGLAAQPWRDLPSGLTGDRRPEVSLDCGWGRLVFGQTFDDFDRLAAVLADERPGRRDICLYTPDAHVLVSQHPSELFIDPSYTFRLRLEKYRPAVEPPRAVNVRLVHREGDPDAINQIYAKAGMVAAPVEVLRENQRSRTFTYLVAEDATTGDIVGTVTGVDHHHAVGGPEQGASLWCLAVDPQCSLPGVGEALVRTLAEHYITKGRTNLDLSVMHDNEPAIQLYEKLGFERVPILCVKRKNPLNEPLFTGDPDDIDRLNPYARIIADEARQRGIAVEVLDAEGGYLRLSHGGREIVTRESLSELTTAVAMSRCDDKRVTKRTLAAAGLRVPRARTAVGGADDHAFLAEVGSVVVKPARGEQGRGITVGVNDPDALDAAVEEARVHCPDVILEEYRPGRDLRIVVIDHQVVAAAVRRPATVVGTGRHRIDELIERQSRRRAAATGGESTIPLDGDTMAAVRAADHELDDVLELGAELEVRRTANLHTGGTIHDVTDVLHPALAEAAVAASRALDIPVTGIDLIVDAPDRPDHVIIEANERPGLANHEPRPTAERFVDLLFPTTSAIPRGWGPQPTPRHVPVGDHVPDGTGTPAGGAG
jgi:GNAT-family acetyltransferase (TIGR03103 family)